MVLEGLVGLGRLGLDSLETKLGGVETDIDELEAELLQFLSTSLYVIGLKTIRVYRLK